MEKPIISVSGLRGILGTSLDPLLVIRYAAAFVSGLPAGSVVVTRDGRSSGSLLVDAVSSAITALGRTVLDGGIAATPTTGVLVRETEAVGGIQISASHNPPEYNGLKLFSAAGSVITASAGQAVLARYEANRFDWVPYQHIGQRQRIADTTSAHRKAVLATVDVAGIRARRFRVLLDSNHGAGSLLGQQLLGDLGCDVTCLGDVPDGQFAHPAEPTEENLSGVRTHIVKAEADIGFCQDPDADRLAVVDESGRYIGEEYTLALCLDHVLRQNRGPIVTNCATSRMSEDLAQRHDAPFFRSAVGEANVTSLMRSEQAIFGGEGNGGPIDPRVGYVRDSFVGMALILDAMAARELPVSQLADELPRYAIHKSKVALDADKTGPALDAIKQHFHDAQTNTMDGLRLDWPGEWLLVRASNTEPIVRAIAEAATIERAEALCAEAARVMESL